MRKQMETRKRRMHEMKNTILSFALPLLLLAAQPAVADDARLLWVSVDGTAEVVGAETNVADYVTSGKTVNAFRVSVPDASASGGTNHLAFAYEENGSMVVGETEPVVRSLDFTNGGAAWAPLDLAAYDDPDLVVTMELGYVAPGGSSSFEKLAFATETLGNLLDAPHVSIQSDLNPPAVTPWAPMTFTVTVPWAIAYDLAGGTNNAVNPESYTEGQLPIALLPAGREGYTFAGWTNELGAVVSQLVAGSTGDRSFGATWLENVEPPALGSKVYNGALQTADVPASGGYTVAANAGGTDVGTYDVVLALASGYAWSDGTIADKTVTWSIAPAVAMTLSVPDETTGVVMTNYFATLAEAFGPNGAKDGDTVELLADVTLTERIEPNVGANTAITIDLGGHTITRTGTSGNGSAFDVKSGDVTITNGVIDCTQNDTAIAKDGVYAITSRSGSTVTLAGLTVTVDSECGACAYPFAGSTMTIESGTYANVTTTPYRYNTAITGMAVNQPNNATQNLVIKGGSFSQYDPQLGDDSGAMTDFTDDGFVAIDDGNGHFVVQPGYNVTFDANGGDPTPAAQRVAAGGKATAPTAPTKERYTFRAWQTNGVDWVFTDAVPSDMTLVADWTIDAFDVIWVADGATVLSNRLDYGATITAPATDPTKAGDDGALYTFVGWTPAPDATVSSNATYTAAFKTWTKVAVPTGTDYTYDGTEKTGVADGAGYTRSGDYAATDAGDYTATVALADPANTVWADDTTAPTVATNKTVAWSIEPATLTITVAGYNGVYDGAAHAASAATVPDGATVTWSVDGGEFTDTVPSVTGVANVTIVAKAALANYADATATTSLVVTAKAVTVTAQNASKVAGNADPELAATVTGLVDGESESLISYTVSRAAGETAGTYAITPTGDATQGNYTVSFVPGTLTITGAQAAVISVADATLGTMTTNYVDTLAAAFTVARDGDTVLLLENVTLASRLEPNVGANTAITIDLGGYTITREGTSGNGSVFDVKSGDVTITNGVIDSTQNDTAIAKDGVYAITSRSGSTVTLAGLTVTVDSECGACAYPFAGSTMTIESGTYANVTTTPYRYNTAITGMAVNQPNNATQNLVIKGGSFSQYDPQLGDDSGAMTDFTDDGFVAIDDGNGHFVVQPGYNVTFDANGGDPTPAAQRVAAGGKATAPTAPTKERHSFRAWQLNGADYDFETVLSSDITLVADWTMTAVYVAQVGETKYSTIAAAIEAAGGLVANPEVITLLTNADASVTLTAPAQRLRVALDGHELTVLSGDPIRYEVATNVEDGVTVYVLEQLKADGLMIVRFDYEAAKLAYDMGTAENMLKMYPTNEPIWCTIATATDLAAPLWTTVENSRAWKENLVPLANVTDADLEWLENLDTTSSPIRFWRIAVTPFALTPNEEVGFKPPRPAGD